jgi:hypothetical protein
MAITLITLFVIASAAGLFWMLRSQPQPARRRAGRVNVASSSEPVAPPRPARPGGIDKLQGTGLFWGVEIGTPGCEAARDLMGNQYTFDEAPELPLPACSSAICTCQFNGLRDNRERARRSGNDRRDDIRFDKDRPERRKRRGRRRSDRWNDHSF